MYAISIHPPRVGRDALQPGKLLFRPISIHPPREGRDLWFDLQSFFPGYFNPPSPWGEGPCWAAADGSYSSFQSTLPVWGGTVCGGIGRRL